MYPLLRIFFSVDKQINEILKKQNAKIPDVIGFNQPPSRANPAIIHNAVPVHRAATAKNTGLLSEYLIHLEQPIPKLQKDVPVLPPKQQRQLTANRIDAQNGTHRSGEERAAEDPVRQGTPQSRNGEDAGEEGQEEGARGQVQGHGQSGV
jgi:hypothetical protein